MKEDDQLLEIANDGVLKIFFSNTVVGCLLDSCEIGIPRDITEDIEICFCHAFY